MAQHDTGHRTWKVTNEGQADLHLKFSSSTCSCTIANLERGKEATVKPGESTTVELKWETKDNNGKYQKSATITTDDLERPALAFIVDGQVRPAVVTIPPDSLLNFLTISNDEPARTMRVAVFSPDKPDMKITAVKTSRPDLVVATHQPMNSEELATLQKMEVKGGHRIDVEIKSGMPLGAFRDEVIVETDHPLQHTLKLIVLGKMTGPITVVPERLRLHDVQSERGGQGEVTLLVRGMKETHFQVMQKPESFQVDITPSNQSTKAGKYRVKVTIPPGTRSEEIEDQIIIKTDHPQADELRIPIEVYIKNAG
jgi:hypothetical protein